MCSFLVFFFFSFSHLWWPFWFTSFAWHTNKTSFFFVFCVFCFTLQVKIVQNHVKIAPVSWVHCMWWWFIAHSWRIQIQIHLILLFVNWLHCVHKNRSHIFSHLNHWRTIWSNVMCVKRFYEILLKIHSVSNQLKFTVDEFDKSLNFYCQIVATVVVLSRSNQLISIVSLWIDQHITHRNTSHITHNIQYQFHLQTELYCT